MKFPFVFRSHHDEMVAELRRQLVDRERELHRLTDLIFKNTFGVQLHDTIAEAAQPLEAPEVPLSPEKEAELKAEQEAADERARLTSIWRTRPSQLGPYLERAMKKSTRRRAQAARPIHAVTPAGQVFSTAMEEALK